MALTRTNFFLTVGTVGWLAALVCGFAGLQRYTATAGPVAPVADHADSLLTAYKKAERPLLVMAVHPECPCTRASLGELGDLLARSRGACDALLIEYRPANPPADWPATPVARELGGVQVPVVVDRNGELAARLGARTSGYALFMDAAGAVRFHGGLTISRGHRDRAPAQDAILALLRGQPATLSEAPVYGCALVADCQPPPGT